MSTFFLQNKHEADLSFTQGAGHNVRPLHVMVSIGTGRMPKYGVKALDVYRPEGLFDIAKVAFGATALGKLLVDQVR